MGVMEHLANATCEMGISRGDDHPCGCFRLVLDLDDSSQRMFGFDTGFFMAGEPKNFVPMLGNKLTGKQQHPAWRVVSYPFTGRAISLVTVRWDRAPHPAAFVIHRLALTADGWLSQFALRLVRVVLPRSNRSIFVIPGKM
jgi:hypothetical protein